MSRHILADTGPIVAYLSRRDKYHGWASAQLDRFAPPLFSCEPVITEACFLLRELPEAVQKLLSFLRDGHLRLIFDLEAETDRVAKLMAKYSDLPMSLADACLVRMTELQSESVVLTLDSDFRLYRRHGRQVIPAVMPDDI